MAKKSRKASAEVISADDELNIRRSVRFVEELEDQFAKYNKTHSNKNLDEEVICTNF